MKCALCYGVEPLTPLWEDFERCPVCGVVVWKGLRSLTDADCRRLYGPAYFAGSEYADYAGDEAMHKRNFRRRVRVLAGYAPSGRLLEIGSAYGFFLDVARERWDVQGVDVAAHACAHARDRLGLPVQCGEFLELHFEPARYAAVCLWDTLEHLRDPGATVRKAAALLKPGGVLCLTTGDIDSLNARVRGRKWRLLHPPSHLYYFSRRSLRTLLERNGLTIARFGYARNDRSLGGMLRIAAAARAGHLASRLLRVLPIGWLNGSLSIDLLDILFVIARKR